MAVKSDYKFKPYTPVNLKMASPKDASLSQQEKTLKALQSQKENLNARLLAEGVDPETLGGEFDNRNLIEKALNLRPNQGLLMDFIEVINRPVEAVKGALVAGVEGQNVLEGFFEGVSGQEVIRGSEFLKRATGFEPETGVGKFIADVGVDIAFDPLTYLPAGFFIKKLSGLKKLGSRTIPKIGEELISNSAILAKEAVETGGQAVIKNAAQIDNLVVDGALYMAKEGPGSVAEKFAKNNYESAMKAYLKKQGLGDFDNYYKVVFEGAQKEGARNLKDLAVYYKVGDDKWVKIARTEVKDVVGQAFAFKGAFNLEDLASDVSRTNGVEFINRVSKSGLKTKNGEDVLPLVKKALEGDKTGLKNFFDEKVFDKETISGFENIVKDILFDDLGNSGINYMTFRIDDTRTVTMSLKNAREYTKITSANITVNVTGSITNKAVKDFSNKMGVNFDKMFRTSSKAKNATTWYNKKVTSIIDNTRTFQTGSGGVFVQGVDLNSAKLDNFLGEIFKDAKGKIFKVTDIGVLEDGTTLYLKGTNAPGLPSEFRSALDLFDPKTNKKFTVEELLKLDETDNFMEGLLKTTTQETLGVTETITLAGRARAGEFGDLAKNITTSLKKLQVNFKLNFNLTGGLSDEVADLVKASYGENLFELERRSARLTEIQQQLMKVDPEAGKYLGEIIEAGAKVVDGKVVKMSRSMGLSDFLDYSLKRLEDGAEIILPSFPDDAAKLNFLKKLNKRYQGAFSTTDDLFEVVVGANGGTVLRVKGDASDLKEIIKQYGDEKLIRPIAGADDYVQFGEKSLSKGARDLLLSQSQLVDDYSLLSDEILQELIDVAGFDKLPSELAGQIGYMRHVMSKEAYAGLQRQLPGVASLFARPGSDTLAQRTFLGSAQEVNAAMKEFMNLDMDLFDPNAFNAMDDLIKVAQRKLDQSRVLDIVLKESGIEGEALMRVVANTQDARKAMSPYDTMFKSFKEEFSALYKNLSPDGQAQLNAYFQAGGYGADKAVVMNKSAYNVLKGAEKAYIQIPELVKTYDKFLNTWKGVTLVSPGFHLRNMFGNVFNSYAIGMDTVAQSKYLGVAVTELDQFSKVGKKLAQNLDISPAEKELFDTVRGYFEHGVSQTHRGIRDLEQLKSATSAAAGAGGKIKTGYNNLLKFNFNIAEKSDDIQRYALYRWGLDKTGDANKAARTVSEALFDYSHLTPFEKDYMKRIFPFYTFMKNNFIFQAKNIFANPKQYARVGRAYNYAIENLSGYSQEDLPEYATENMWLPLPISVSKNDKAGIAFLKANLPLSDFTELVENPFRKGVTSLTAPVKLIIEFGAGRDLFTGAPLQAFPGQQNAMEAGTGVLSGLRDQRGNFTISQSPLFQKILNDIGLRTPMNFASAGLDLVDTLAGYQGPKEGLGDFMVRAGIVGIQEKDRMELTKLYQDLEKLRNLKRYYEQETGNQLPVLPR